MKTRAIVLALLGGFLGFLALGPGAASAVTPASIDFAPRLMQSGFYSGASGALSDSNRVTNVLAGSITYDFASATITCLDSTAITVTGAAVGDPCFVGIDAAGAAAVNASFSCYSAANAVYVRFCPAGTASNPASTVFKVRVIAAP